MENNKKIVVLHVLGCLGMGGAENRIMDLVRRNDDPDIEYAFLVNSEGPDSKEIRMCDCGTLKECRSRWMVKDIRGFISDKASPGKNRLYVGMLVGRGHRDIW